MRLFLSLIAGVAALFVSTMASAALNVSASTPGGQTTFNTGDVVTVDVTISTTGAEALALGLRAANYDPTILTNGQGTVVPTGIFGVAPGNPLGGIANTVGGEEEPPQFMVREGWSINLFQGVSVTAAAGSAPELFQVQFIAGLPGVTQIDIGALAGYADTYIGGDNASTPASLVITVIPEPGTALLMGLGLAGLATSRDRRARR